MMTFTKERTAMVQNYDLDSALSMLRQGRIILYPTDTIWSIGCDATNPVAIEKLNRLKKNDQEDFEILVDSIQMLKNYVDHLHPRIETLLIYHVRPLTIIFDNPRNLPSNAISRKGTISVRLVQDEYCRNLIKEYGCPLLASFAKFREEPFPVNFGGVARRR